MESPQREDRPLLPFKDVKEEDGKVVFTLQDGSTIEIPKEKPFAFTLSESKAIVASGSTVEIPYTLTGGDETTIVDCIATGNISAFVNTEKKVVVITAPATAESGKVVVFATRADKSIVRVINFVGCSFTVSANEIKAAPAGETIKFSVTTDLEKMATSSAYQRIANGFPTSRQEPPTQMSTPSMSPRPRRQKHARRSFP